MMTLSCEVRQDFRCMASWTERKAPEICKPIVLPRRTTPPDSIVRGCVLLVRLRVTGVEVPLFTESAAI